MRMTRAFFIFSLLGFSGTSPNVVFADSLPAGISRSIQEGDLPSVPKTILIPCDIAPDDARLEIDGKLVPRVWKIPCSVYLAPGEHKVVVVDPQDRFPAFEDRAFNVDKSRRPIKVDLRDNLGTLEIVSPRPLRLAVDGTPYGEGSSFKLRPGNHRLEFSAVSDPQCFVPHPEKNQILIDPKNNQTFRQTVKVDWEEKPAQIIYIQPMLLVGGAKVPPRDAVVEIDGVSQRPADGNTAYRVPCSARNIEVRSPAFSTARLGLGSGEAKKYIRQGIPWPPELVEAQLTGLHVDCHEVTVGDFLVYANAENPAPALRPKDVPLHSVNWNHLVREKRKRHPVNRISYDAAQKYCEWRAAQAGIDPRASRVAGERDLLLAAGYTGHRYPWLGTEDPTCERVIMWEQGKGPGCASARFGQATTAEVCSKPKGNGPFGHCDLLGNVAEWVSDDTVLGGGFRNTGTKRVFDLGAGAVPQKGDSDNVGFRCAWDLAEGETCSCLEVDHTKHGE